MNCLVDRAAKDYLCGLIRKYAPINFDVPYSGWTVTTNSSLDKGPLTVVLQDYIYHQKARYYWVTQRCRFNGAAFDLIDWFTIQDALNFASSGFKLWATKLVTSFCATAR
eukprot:15033196-Ditylum_brightwellii.AAC.1